MTGMASASSPASRPILVVDDDAKIVRLVRTYLERAGYRVVEAADGRAALAAIALEMPALVVLDLMLPEVDGLAVLRPSAGPTGRRSSSCRPGASSTTGSPGSPRAPTTTCRSRSRRPSSSCACSAILERTGGGAPAAPAASAAAGEPIRHGDLVVDRERHEVRVDGRPSP